MAKTIAVLGATGKTGREVLKRLLTREDVNIRIYVRSLSKLLGIFGSLYSNERVAVFEGSLNDIDNMCKCLDGAEQIIFAIGENDNIPGVRVIEDGAKSVLAALSLLRKRQREWQRPRVLLLSSATWNPVLAADRPAIIHWAIKTAFIYPYADLLRGQATLLDASSLINVLLVQPNGLVEDEPTGHEISVERASFSSTYGDLGAAFVELACSNEYDELPAVGVSSKDGNNALRYGPPLAYLIIRGLLATFLPGFWTMNRTVNMIASKLTFQRKAS